MPCTDSTRALTCPALSDAPASVVRTVALIASVLSVLSVAALLLRPGSFSTAWRTVLVIMLFLLWLSVVWFATFAGGPFTVTGNGYFAAWLGGACAFLALLVEANRANASILDVRDAATRHLKLVLAAASFVVVVEASGGRHGFMLYALIVGCVSLTLVIAGFIHEQIRRTEATDLAASVTCTACRTAFTNEMLLALFLTVWWAVGTSMMTFSAPFTATSNAYFAAWMALYCACAMLIGVLRAAADTAADAQAVARGDRRAHYGLILACAVLMGACVAVRGSGFGSVWALVVCGLTLPLVGCLLLSLSCKVPPVLSSAIVLILLVAWASVVWLTTFTGRFVVTGNGFFAAWLGLGCSTLLVAADETGQGKMCLAPCARKQLSSPRHHERQSLTLAAAAEAMAPAPAASPAAAKPPAPAVADVGLVSVCGTVDAGESMVEVTIDDASTTPRPLAEPSMEQPT